MTLEDLLNSSKLTPEEVSNNLAYKKIKNDISEEKSNIKKSFMSNLNFVLNDIVENNLCHKYGCYSQEKIVFSDEEKKELLNFSYKISKRNIKRYEKTIHSLLENNECKCDHEDENNSEDEKTIDSKETVSITPLITNSINDMFGY